MSELQGQETAANIPQQEDLPLAIVQGQPFKALPDDLYIPPDALEIFLETFEGPLDLLLYLIRKENLDILDIPVAEITRQYVEYIELMQGMRLELAGEYLVMSAMLAEIKSRMLLPCPVSEETDEDDPRAELVRRLQEYERFKQAADEINELPRLGRDVYLTEVACPDQKIVKLPPEIYLPDLVSAFQDVMQRAAMYAHHHVQLESLSVRERMSSVLSRVRAAEFTRFADLFTIEEGRMGVVVTFLAILELSKESLLEISQSGFFAPVYVKAAANTQETGPASPPELAPEAELLEKATA